jgi:hypothetical protein
MLAKYIREGTPCLEYKKPYINARNIEEFYTMLWGTRPEIGIPFEYDSSHTNESIEDETLRAITGIEITSRINRMKNSSAPGPDGISKRHRKHGYPGSPQDTLQHSTDLPCTTHGMEY